jgi:TolB-like protein/Flp pilus assembly protein TadD
MAPEQAAGDPGTDHRADIYAFGCLAYEVFTGNPPFHGLTKHQTVAAHLMTVPPAIGTIRPDVPPVIADLIARCLEKEAGARPQTAREVLRALDAPASGSGSWTAPAPATARRSRKPLVVALALIAVVGVGGYLLTGSRESARPISIAVLPFFNTNADSSMDFVGDGLADEVASALARVPGIQIKSRSGARLYQNVMAVDPIEAGSKLKAQYVMTALLRQERGRWILSADLTRAADATSIWDERFNLDPDQSPQVAHLVATSLVAGLQRTFPRTIGAVPALAATQRTANSDAHRLWLGGQEKLSRRGQSVKESADLFRAAIREDSLFAGAWSGLSMAMVLFPHFQGTRVDEVRREVEHAARRALELDPTLAQPHVALGMLHQFDYEWDRAEANYQEAIRLEPRNVEARIQYTRHLLFRGRPAEALSQVLVARAEDPASAVVIAWAAYAYFLDGQPDSALAESRRAVETDSTSIHVGISAMIRAWLNRVNEALPLIELVPSNYAVAGYMRAKYGDSAAARQLLRDLDAQAGSQWAVESRKAFTYLGFGDTAKALTALERATDAREIWGVWDPIASPIFDPVRETARFREIVRRIGLADPATFRRVR